jgi:hypothetical protein
VKQQQQQQQHHMTAQGPQPDFFKPNVHDALNQIQANFGELNIKEQPVLWTVLLQMGKQMIDIDGGSLFACSCCPCCNLNCTLLKGPEVTIYK